MNDPTVTTLADRFPDRDLDPHWIGENLAVGRERCDRQVPLHYATATATEPAVRAWVEAILDAAIARSRSACITVSTGPSLLILGPTGTGKTFQAYGAVRALSVSGAQCRWQFTTAADLYARLRPQGRGDTEKEFQAYATAKVLVLDDLGAAKGSEWVEEINYRLINHRYGHQLPTIVTSNVPPKDLGAAVGERVASRLIEMSHRVVLRGEDRRRRTA